MSLSRRSLMAGIGALGLSRLGLGQRARRVKVAFLTDTHVGNADQYRRAVKAFEMAARGRPDVMIFGGDNVMNVDGRKSYEQTKAQFDLWGDLIRNVNSIPKQHVIGNHDIWWTPKESPHPELHEKGYAVRVFGMPKRYYRWETGGWAFLMLDCFHADGCQLDPEQRAWLEAELAKGSGPVCLVTHAPILSASHFKELGPPKNGVWSVPTSWQLSDAVSLMDLFVKHPRVKLSLSGHMHHVDRVDYKGVTYVCGGAVSGSWWSGEYHGFGPAYVELELGPEGMQSYRPVWWEKGT